MKSIAIIQLLAFALQGGIATNEFDLLPGKITKDNAPAMLSSMMQAAQTTLAKAQRHHERVVQKVRKQVVSDFSFEADTVGSQIGEFAAELDSAAKEIEVAVNASKVGLAASEARAKKSTNWQDAEVEDRAKLNAQTGSAERNMKKMLRRSAQAIHSAEERSESSMEDESEKLSMKLGDLSTEYSAAKSELESNVTVTQANATAKMSEGHSAATPKGKDLKSLENNLADTLAKSQASIKGIQTKMDQFLGKIDKDVETRGSKIEDLLNVAQKKEIEKVLGHSPTSTKAAPKAKSEAAPKAKSAAAPKAK